MIQPGKPARPDETPCPGGFAAQGVEQYPCQGAGAGQAGKGAASAIHLYNMVAGSWLIVIAGV